MYMLRTSIFSIDKYKNKIINYIPYMVLSRIKENFKFFIVIVCLLISMYWAQIEIVSPSGIKEKFKGIFQLFKLIIFRWQS